MQNRVAQSAAGLNVLFSILAAHHEAAVGDNVRYSLRHSDCQGEVVEQEKGHLHQSKSLSSHPHDHNRLPTAFLLLGAAADVLDVAQSDAESAAAAALDGAAGMAAHSHPCSPLRGSILHRDPVLALELGLAWEQGGLDDGKVLMVAGRTHSHRHSDRSNQVVGQEVDQEVGGQEAHPFRSHSGSEEVGGHGSNSDRKVVGVRKGCPEEEVHDDRDELTNIRWVEVEDDHGTVAAVDSEDRHTLDRVLVQGPDPLRTSRGNYDSHPKELPSDRTHR